MNPKGVAIFGEITIDFDRMEILRSGRIISVTAQEFRLLSFFVRNPLYVFTRDELLCAAWPERKRVNGRTVDNSIAHLRQKIEEHPSSPVYFRTVHGIGYKFVPFAEDKVQGATWRQGTTRDGRPEMRAPF
ncbi:MAG TPA: response regulator transcription factor [Terriglobales bacterium]|jgi:DNA-binding response OmpR family regulator|nr:response regulator transcription factor [Terriglobales bacterium]